MFVLANIPKKQRPIIKAAAEFYTKELLSPQMRRVCAVAISMSNTLSIDGYTDVIECNDANKPREFAIALRNFKQLKRVLITLAHEMVHVKQYAYNEMNETMTRWRGRKIDVSSIAYTDHPWEIEAFWLEGALYKRFVGQFMETQK